LIEQLLAEGDLARLVTFAVRDAEHLSLLIDVLGAHAAQLGAAHTCGVERHQDGAVAEVGGGIDKAGDLLGAEDEGNLVLMDAGERQILTGIAASQDLVVEEAERGDLDRDRMRLDLLLETVELVLSDVLDAELFRRAMEVFGEPPDSRHIGMCGSLGVITALDLFEQPFAKWGHRIYCDPRYSSAWYAAHFAYA